MKDPYKLTLASGATVYLVKTPASCIRCDLQKSKDCREVGKLLDSYFGGLRGCGALTSSPNGTWKREENLTPDDKVQVTILAAGVEP